ncbi:MAG TPA: MerR family transcriptional regulator [Pyrinomonadaceae bacterium]|jgi:DNA-binding transcriptional MerR regulator|nr:MerR family transcriptional regulator [Pyrinomonadaceae bacterium]
MPVLESYRGRDIIGVEELAGIATSLIEHYSRTTLRASSRLAISPRIVRHYLSESLLGEPTGQTGTSTIFNYGNLLRLLAVKKLLADHWSVIKIKEFMRALDITALEEMVNTALVSERLAHNDAKAERERDTSKTLRAPEALSTEDEQESASTSTLFAVEPSRRREREVTKWVEIAPGLEIKVRRSFRPPASEEDRAQLVTRIWSVILKEE